MANKAATEAYKAYKAFKRDQEKQKKKKAASTSYDDVRQRAHATKAPASQQRVGRRVGNLTRGAVEQSVGMMRKGPAAFYSADRPKENNTINGTAAHRTGYFNTRRNDRQPAKRATEEYKAQREQSRQRAITTSNDLKRARYEASAQESRAASAQIERGTKKIEQEKSTMSKAGKWAADAYVGGIQLAGDLTVGAVTGTGVAPMVLRAAGGGIHEAEKAGATKRQALVYGAATGAVEGATERLFSVGKILNAGFGKGVGDDIVDRVIKKAANKASKQGIKDLTHTGGKWMTAAITEGLEEVIAEGVEPELANAIYDAGKATLRNNPQEAIKNMAYAGSLGAALGGIAGGGGVLMEQAAGRRMVNRMDADTLKHVARTASTVDDKRDAARAQALHDQLDSGRGITSIQASELSTILNRQARVNNQKRASAVGAARKEIVRNGYSQIEWQLDAKRSNEVADRTQDLINRSEWGEESENVKNRSQELSGRMARIETGKALDEDIDTLINDPIARTVFEHMTGQTIPSDVSDARDFLYTHNATSVVNLAEEQTKIDRDRAYTRLVTEKEKEYGDKGQHAHDKMFAGVETRDQEQVADLEKGFDLYYSGAMSDYSFNELQRMFKDDPRLSGMDIEMRRAAYDAGLNDNRAQVQASARRQEARTNSWGRSGAGGRLDTSGLSEDNQLTPEERSVLSDLADKLGIEIRVVDEIKTKEGKSSANEGMYDKGVVTLAKNVDRSLLSIFSHEITHHLEDYAPGAWMSLRNYVVEHWSEIAPRIGRDQDINVEIERKIKLYREHDQNLSREGAIKEIIAETPRIFTDTESINDIVKADRSTGVKILEAIREVLRKIRAIIAEHGFENTRWLQEDRDVLKQAERLWMDALAVAQTRRGAVGDINSDGVRLAAQDNSSIKTQIREHLDELSNMDPVANIEHRSITGLRRSEKADVIVDEYQKEFGDTVLRDGFGEIEISYKMITGGLKYMHTEGEFLSFFALPYVLRDGKEIHKRVDHKHRAYDTVTIAAPVTINGVDGYMGAVVKVAGKNRYRAHRIISPDGTEIELIDEKKTEPIGADVIGTKTEQRPAISSASNRIIDEPIPEVNTERRSIADGFENGDANVPRFSVREADPPKKTKGKIYKLLKLYPDGSLGALFIDKGMRLQVGEWYDADSPAIKDLENLETGHTYFVDADGNASVREYKSKSGNPGKKDIEQATRDGGRLILVDTYKDGSRKYHNWGINGSGSVSTFAMRPGWHATDAPAARHIGAGKNGGESVWRREDEVWCEISLAADVDYQQEAEANTSKDIQTHIPTDGYYYFKTNTNADDDQAWYISGAIRIDRILSDDEAEAIAKENGVTPDLPRKSGRKFDPKEMDGWFDEDQRLSITEDSKGRKLTEGQMRYFANSKAVDENGNLAVVYHGTGTYGFYTFYPDYHRKWIFFTDNKDVADSYIDYESVESGGAPGTYEEYLNLENPLILDAKEQDWTDIQAYMGEDVQRRADELEARFAELEAKGELTDEEKEERDEILEELDELPMTGGDTDSVARTAMEEGHDGVIIKNLYDTRGPEVPATIYIAFKQNQIKSVDNENPTDNPDTRFSIEEVESKIRESVGNRAAIGAGVDASGNIRYSIPTEINAHIKGDGRVESVRAMRNRWMIDRKRESKALDAVLDRVGDFMVGASDLYEYISLEDVQKATVAYRTDADGNPQSVILSCQVANGEYEVNFDFTTICKKRESFQKVIEDLYKEGVDELDLTEENIFQINQELQKYGFETACPICFVEARRYANKAYAEKIVSTWNAAVDKINPDAENFDFANANIEEFDYQEIDRALRNTGIGEGMNFEQKVEAIVKSSKVFQKKLQQSDILTNKGVQALKAMSNKDNSLFGYLKQSRGASAPKEIVAFNAYNGEIELLPEKMKSMPLADYLASIAGARLQSFSDFQIENLYDYMQLVAGMAARRIPCHVYTKEVAFVRLFGMTGMKTNMSIVCDVDPNVPKEYAGLTRDENGEWVYNFGEQSFPWEWAIKLQRDKRYSKNVGTILVGLSDPHILKALDDPDIRFIIPYHASGLPKDIMASTHLGMATDYTKFQNTCTLSEAGLTALKEAGYETDIKALYEKMGAKKALRYLNKAFAKIGLKPSYVKKTEAGYGNFDLYGDVEQTKNPRKTADNYIEYCMEKGSLPLFFQFAGHKNYYKTLYDFDVYDSVTGRYAPQRAVQNIYPGMDITKGETDTGELEAIATEYLDEREEIGRQTSGKYADVMTEIKSNIFGMEYEASKENGERFSITAGMSDEDRYQELKDKTLDVHPYRKENMPDTDEDLVALASQMKKQAFPVLKRIAADLGVTDFDKAYTTPDLDVEFYYSANRLDESANKQAAVKSDRKYVLLAQMLTCFDQVIENARLIETHDDRYEGTKRMNPDFKRAHLLISAFTNEDGIVPVKLLVKENDKEKSTLHVSIALPEMKRADQHGQTGQHDQYSPLSVLSDYSLADLLREVKRIDEDGLSGTNGSVIGKYIPAQFVETGARLSISDEPSEPVSDDDVFAWMAEHPDELIGDDDIRDLPAYDQRINASRERRERTLEEIRQAAQWVKDETKLTHGRQLDPRSVKESVNGVVRRLMEHADTSRRTSNQYVKLATASCQAMRGYLLDDDFDSAADIAYDTAMEIIENVRIINDTYYEEYKSMRDFFREVRIRVPEEWRNERYNELRKQNFGRLIISNDGEDIDELWQEICDTFPGHFDKDALLDPMEMLEAISEEMDSVKPFAEEYASEEMDSIASVVAMDLMEISWAGKPIQTFADRKKAQYDQRTKALKARHREALKEVRAKAKERADARIKAEREKKKEAVKKVREQGKEKLREERQVQTEKRKEAVRAERERGQEKLKEEKEKGKARVEEAKARGEQKLAEQKGKERERNLERRENAAKREALRKMGNNVKWLSERLLSPTDDKHLPEGYRKAVAQILAVLDLQTERSKKLEEKYGISKKRFRWLELKRQYEEIASGESYGFVLDEELLDLMDTLAEELEDHPLSDATAEELEIIHKVVQAIRHGIAWQNRAFSEALKARTDELGHGTIRDAEEKLEKYGQRKDLWFLTEGMATPRDYFEGLGGDMETAFLALRAGMDTHIRDIDEIRSMFTEIFGQYAKRKKPGSELESWRDNSQTQKFDLESGGSIELNPSQIMSLYCLMKREQAMGHILGSGIIASEVRASEKIKDFLTNRDGTTRRRKIAEYFAGKNPGTRGQKVLVSFADIESIVSTLTEDQRAMADRMQGLLNTTMAEWGNETSMRMFGYRKFEEKNYFPIKVQSDYLATDFDVKQTAERVKNPGFGKSTVKGAQNPIVIADIFEVVADHCNAMSMYKSFAPAIADFQRVYNYVERDESGRQIGSVKEALKACYGQNALKYIERFMTDLNGTTPKVTESLTSIATKSLANYKKAAIGGNLRVGLQQPTAIIRAFTMIDPKYFIGGFSPIRSMREMREHCPIGLWKSWGFNDVDMARSMEEIMMNKEWSRIDAVTMEIYGRLDELTWGQIWAAVKRETRAKHKDVAEGSQEFWDLCNERASEIFDKTQVVDSVFHKSQMMRNSDVFSKMTTSFMAEPTRTFNMMWGQMRDAHQLWKDGEKGKSVAKANRALTVFVLNAAVCAAAAAIADTLRGKGGDDDDDKDKTALARYITNIIENFKDMVNPIGLLPWFKDIWGFKDGFGSSNMAQEGYDKLVRAWMDIVTGNDKKTTSEKIKALVEGIGYVTGLPTKNIMREVETIFGLVGIDAIAADKNEETPQRSRKMLEFFGIKDGSRADNILNRAGIGLTDMEIKEKEFQARVDEINSKVDGLEGYEREDQIWSLATKGYTKMVEAGDYSGLADIRRLLSECGGDVERFDEKVLSKSKTVMKRSIGDDMDPAQIEAAREYMFRQGMTRSEISHDVIAKSDAAKEYQQALAEGDDERMMDLLTDLVAAGLTFEDMVELDHKVYSKGTGEFAAPVDGGTETLNTYRNQPMLNIAAPEGTDITAIDNGRVTFAGWKKGYGYTVTISHGNGYTTYYNHLQSYGVRQGDVIQKGKLIAKCGSSGDAFESGVGIKVKHSGKWIDPGTLF